MKIVNCKLKIDDESGYIALMSAIIISAVLTTVVFALNSNSFLTRFSILENEYKKRSFNLAETCANLALLKKVEDLSYAGGETLLVKGKSCLVSPLNSYGSEYVIDARANIGGAISNIRLNVDKTTLVVTKQFELP